jgi:predicted neutral ceramidase superfamily lipid hydrolase
MGHIRDIIDATKKVFTPIRLNIIFLIVNIAVGVTIQNTPLIVSSFVALLGVIGVSLLVDREPIGSYQHLIHVSDQIVVASVMVAIFVMWFDTKHHIRSLSGLILLYAFGIFLIGKLNMVYNSPSNRKHLYEILHYFGSFGHFLFNLEYALLVLI